MINRKLADETRWPVPGDEMSALAYRLRYQEKPEYDAASIVEAYAHLIALPARARSAKVRMIRQAAGAGVLATDVFCTECVKRGEWVEYPPRPGPRCARCGGAMPVAKPAEAAGEARPAPAELTCCPGCGHVHGFRGICAVPLGSATLCTCKVPQDDELATPPSEGKRP